MTGPGNRHSTGRKEFPADLFVEQRPVLDGIVQRNPLQAMEGLALDVLVKVQRKRRIAIHITEAAGRSFEVHRDIFVYAPALAHDSFNGRTFLLVVVDTASPASTQDVKALLRDFDLDPKDFAIREDVLRRYRV